MILITGAAGKTGRAILRAVVGRGGTARVLVRSESQFGALQSLGASECVAGDLRDPAALRQATQGIEALYLICPNVNPHELDIGRSALTAAREAGVSRFVYHSVLHPHVEPMPHHWQKLRVEEAIFEAGLPFTILQPTAYMQNLQASWASIVEQGVYAVPYAPATRLSLVDLEDVAQAAAHVLLDSGHTGAIYELVGTPGLSQIEVAETLGRELGRSVRAEAIDRGQWQARSKAAGLPDFAAGVLLKMFEYYERHGMVGSPGVLTWLLGRAPTTLAEFVRRTAAG